MNPDIVTGSGEPQPPPLAPSTTAPINPIRRLRMEAGMDVEAFAARIAMTPHTLSNLERGSIASLRDGWRANLVAAGYDFDAVRLEYVSWRESMMALPSSAEEGDRPAPTLTEDVRQSIQDAIQRGARGLMSISRESGQPLPVVQTFLREGVA